MTQHVLSVVFVLDEMQGKEAKAAGKHPSQLLSTNWKQSGSHVCAFVC
jgi:hypothetical protein